MAQVNVEQKPVFSERITKILIAETVSLKEALKRMDDGQEKTLIIVNDNNCLLGTLTDGDIRRWILRGGDLAAPVSKFFNQRPKTVYPNYEIAVVKEIMLEQKAEVIPIIDKEEHLIDLLFRSEVFAGESKQRYRRLTTPVLIMAGGRGTRLDPFTRILPKPLIPIGEKPVVEIIMDRFSEFGYTDFYLTVNYKAKMIQSYFENADCPHKINLISENSPRGTAGSLKEAVAKTNLYSTLHARQNAEDGKKSNLFKIIFFPKAKFLENILTGKGFVFAILHAFHSFLAWSKQWLQN